MARRDMSAGGIAVHGLIIEEYIRPERLQERTLRQPAQEDRLVDTDIPVPQSAYDTFVRRRRTRRHQCSPDGALTLALNAL